MKYQELQPFIEMERYRSILYGALSSLSSDPALQGGGQVVEYLKEQGRCKYISFESPTIDEGKDLAKQGWVILLRVMSGVSGAYREFDKALRRESGNSWRLDSISKNKIDKAYFGYRSYLY
jgi:hypothetical protein